MHKLQHFCCRCRDCTHLPAMYTHTHHFIWQKIKCSWTVQIFSLLDQTNWKCVHKRSTFDANIPQNSLWFSPLNVWSQRVWSQESVLHTSWPHQVSHCTVGFSAGQHTLSDSSLCNKVKEEDFHRRLAFLGRQPLWGMGVTSVMETTRSPPVSRPLSED